MQIDVAESQIDPDSMQKNDYCSKLVLFKSFHRIKYIIGGGCLFVLNCDKYFFLSVKLLFLMSSDICKEYREY